MENLQKFNLSEQADKTKQIDAHMRPKKYSFGSLSWLCDHVLPNLKLFKILCFIYIQRICSWINEYQFVSAESFLGLACMVDTYIKQMLSRIKLVEDLSQRNTCF